MAHFRRAGFPPGRTSAACLSSALDQGLTVNAVHVKVLGLLDVVIGSAAGDIHDCA